MVCIGDLHIRAKSDRIFEQERLDALIAHLKTTHNKSTILNLLGDVFDSNTPSLEDIRLFFNFIGQLQDTFQEIRVIAGNHDFKVFKYLPKVGYTFIEEPQVIEEVTYVPWEHLEKFITDIASLVAFHGKTLMTHARCTIEPFIKEEVNIKLLAEKFDTVILGDIHMPYSPYPNVYYTSEPSQTHYKVYQKKSTGYIQFTDKVTRVFTDLPARIKIEGISIAKLPSLLEKLEERNRYKIVVKDYINNLQQLKVYQLPNVKFEVVPIMNAVDTPQAKELQKMVDGKISIEQLLFEYIQANYKFLPETPSKIMRMINDVTR